MLYKGLYWGNNENKIVSETTRHVALIFGMLQNLEDFYTFCSNYDPMAKNGTILGVACFAKKLGKYRKNLLVSTTRHRALVFGM